MGRCPSPSSCKKGAALISCAGEFAAKLGRRSCPLLWPASFCRHRASALLQGSAASGHIVVRGLMVLTVLHAVGSALLAERRIAPSALLVACTTPLVLLHKLSKLSAGQQAACSPSLGWQPSGTSSADECTAMQQPLGHR